MRLVLLASTVLVAAPAGADPLRVVTDIAPLAALVADVQGGRGSVTAVVEPGMDAHHVTLRPSQARALSDADLAVWIGPDLSPWFKTALDRLAPDAAALDLLEHAPVTHERRDPEGHHEEARDDHGPGDEHGHADADGGHGEDHGIDPHAWLDPANAAAWLDEIALALGAADPAAAETYRANAAAARARLEAAVAEIATGPGFVYVAAHDSYRYGEALAGAEFAGAISDSHAADPGPAHLAELEERLSQGDVACLLSAPGEVTRLVRQLSDRFAVPVVTPDLLSAEAVPGGYVAWLKGLHTAFRACLTLR